MDDDCRFKSSCPETCDHDAEGNESAGVIVPEYFIHRSIAFDNCPCITAGEHGELSTGEAAPEGGEDGEREDNVAQPVGADDENPGRFFQRTVSRGNHEHWPNIPLRGLNCKKERGIMYRRGCRSAVFFEALSSRFAAGDASRGRDRDRLPHARHPSSVHGFPR